MKVYKSGTLMKAKNKNFIIPLIIYPFDLMVSVGESDEVLFKKLSQYKITDADLELAKYEDNGIGRYCLFECGASLIRVRKKPVTPFEYGTLQHEIFHVATSIMWRIGMQLKIQTSDEAYAYLIQYLTEEIYSKI